MEEEGAFVGAKTSVWWDIENCQVPRICDPYAVARNIAAALARVGYVGPVSVSAYGDTSRIPTAVQHALSSTGVALNHVPAGVKDASDKKILVDMLFWAVDNPPPANYLLISGDRDFSNALHQLRMRRYNILLAQPPYGSQAMIAAAKSVWSYTSLLAGGSPLPMSSHLGNPLRGNISSAEICKSNTQATVQTTQLKESSFDSSYAGSPGNGGPDTRYKGKQGLKYPNKSSTYIPRSPSNELRLSSFESRGHAGGIQNNVNQYQPGGIQNNVNQQGKHGLQYSNQVSVAPRASSEAQISARFNNMKSSISSNLSSYQTVAESGHSSQPEANQFKEAPHKFFRANKHNAASAPPPYNIPSHPDIPVSKGNPENCQTHYRQVFKPSDLLPPQANSTSGKPFSSNCHDRSLYPTPKRSDGPASTPCTPPSIPDVSKVNITHFDRRNISSLQPNLEPNTNIVLEHGGAQQDMPSSYDDNMHSSLPSPAMNNNMPSSTQGSNPGCPMPSSDVQALMGSILRALHTLKFNKMAPTEENIADCIHYGDMNIQDFNVRMGLGYAIEHQLVVMHKLGGNLPFFIGKNDTLWKCVNIMDVDDRHPKAIWDAVLGFLSSTEGHSAMLASRCRYEAAKILKNSCLGHLVLGDILQILHLMIDVKKWIVPHLSGWHPLSFHLPVAVFGRHCLFVSL